MMEEKKLPNFPKIAHKVATHFLHLSGIIRKSPKSHQNISTTSARQFVAKNLRESHILVTLRLKLGTLRQKSFGRISLNSK